MENERLFEIQQMEHRSVEKTARFLKAANVKEPIELTRYRSGTQDFIICMEHDAENQVFRLYVRAIPNLDETIAKIEYNFIEVNEVQPEETQKAYDSLAKKLEHHILEINSI